MVLRNIVLLRLLTTTKLSANLQKIVSVNKPTTTRGREAKKLRHVRTVNEGNEIWQRFNEVGKTKRNTLLRSLELIGYTRQVFYKHDSQLKTELDKIPAGRQILYMEVLDIPLDAFKPPCLKSSKSEFNDFTVNRESLKKHLKLTKL